MSQIYAEFLDKDHDIIGKDGLKKKLSGNALVASVMSKVLSRGDSASVSLLKEIREATEGTAVNVKIDRFQKIIQSMTEDQISDIFEE
jgi:histidinol dehydrogenase